MSKIALTPNASGTGVFTISSPATSTDRTLTLPDITGTLVSTDASGNVGIGTSSPSQKLTLSSGYVQTGNGVGGAGGVKFPYGGNTGTRNWRARTDLVGYGDWGLEQSTTQTGETYATKLLIDASGNVAINGGVLDSSRLTINGNVSNPNLQSYQNTTAGVTHFWFRNPNGIVGSIVTTGSSTAYNTSSDYRLKEDWQLMSGASERVLALKPVNFAWIVSGERVDGFLAHELADVVPEAVTGTKDGMEDYEITPAVLDDDGNVTTEAVMGTRPVMQGIDQSKLVPLLTAALQEALTEISALKVRVAALEAV